MAEPVVLTRSLTGGRLGQAPLLEALRWPSVFGSAVRLWFARGVQPGLTRDAGDLRVRTATTAGGHVIATAETTVGDGPLRVRLGDVTGELTPAAPETDLFAGLNVLLAQRHHEAAEVVADWLRYHVATQGAQAALILDRTPPGDDRDAFAAKLAQLLDDVTGLARVIVVTSDDPMGMADAPGLGDPLSAPRRWDGAPAPDPWRAPLGQPLVFDALKWRFLADARGVVTLNPPDLLPPAPEGDTVFEAARGSDTGLVAIRGEQIFPWRVRKSLRPAFGDHICRAQPPEGAGNRWAADPRRTGADAMWHPGGIVGMRADAEDIRRFDRCQNVLFPDNAVQDLIVKDRLVGDPALIRRAAGQFGADPVLPPQRSTPAKAATPLPPAPSERTVVVTCMKNEGPFLLEWLAWHRMIGVDDFLIYTNDCDDGTDKLLDLLQARGMVQHRQNPFRETGDKPQKAALRAASDESVVQQAGWILPMDVDEFVNIHVGEGRLPDLYAAIGGANAISLTWRLFGNADIDAFEDVPVTRQFHRCAPHLIRRPHQAWAFKTLYRNQNLFGRLAVHRPKKLNPERAGQVRWVNGSGQPMPESVLRTGWRSTGESYGYDLVTLNHYAVRSAESYLVKRRRGRVNHVEHDQREGYWFRMNNNAEEDRSIRRRDAALDAELAALMADPEIAAAHSVSVARHRAVIADLKADPDYAALFDSLTSRRMKLLSRMHRHFGMNVFLNGPSVIPDSVLGPDTPPDFFFNCDPPSGRAVD
ncbi:glycosyltransferase family 2 protein [Psychromarinibacter sp. S121]|uniref:glycosyltransferase family 2 protein n=1 Tax=Psychromarinibacter sp. S121 TaxID=3415127 RepID=UPI003C7E828A